MNINFGVMVLVGPKQRWMREIFRAQVCIVCFCPLYGRVSGVIRTGNPPPKTIVPKIKAWERVRVRIAWGIIVLLPSWV